MDDKPVEIPYDPELLRSLSPKLAESLNQQRANRNYAAACVYGRTIAGFAERAGRTRNQEPVLAAAHTQWTAATGLPPLRTVNEWRAVAVAANASDEAIIAMERGDQVGLQRLVERIAAFVKLRNPVSGEHELVDHDIRILGYLAEAPGVAKTQADIAEGADCDRKTIGRRLDYLRGIGYVKKPDGRERGSLITQAGLLRIKSDLRKTSP